MRLYNQGSIPPKKLALNVGKASLMLLVFSLFACPPPPDNVPVCGNGIVDGNDQCDDGNQVAGDGCRANCTIEACGDGINDPQDACDDGNQAAGDGCRADCTIEICGDGILDLEAGEQCDDGNNEDGDGCEADCTLPFTGNVCDGVTPVVGTNIALDPVISGLSDPVFLTSPVNDTQRLFIVERAGIIKIISRGQLVGTPFLDIRGQVQDGFNEQGLLSMAFHPNFDKNNKFFVYYTDNGGDTVVSEFIVSKQNPNIADPASERVILTQDQFEINHNGGLIKFGPDGFLYIALGDGGGANDPQNNGQDLGTRLGKMLRIDIDNGDPFAIPADNPFVGQAGALDEIWSFGLRNPWRFSFDRETGDMYIGDVGQNQREEINFEPTDSPGGVNYGWDLMEGDGICQSGVNCNDPKLNITRPIVDFNTSGTFCAIVGGYSYRGCAMPDLHGTYFLSDFCDGAPRTLKVNKGVAIDEQDLTGQLGDVGNISSFGEDAQGELYIIKLFENNGTGGSISKIVPAP